MPKTLDQLSAEIDSAMQNEDFITAVNSAKEIISRPLDDVGMEAFIKASIVFAYSLIKLGRAEDAKNVLNSLAQSGIGLRDAYFLLFAIHYEDRNVDAAIEIGAKFLDQIPDPKSPPDCVTNAPSSAFEIANNLGTMLLSNENFSEAAKMLEKGIAHKDDFDLLYINLGIAYFRQGMFKDAKDTLLLGVSKCHEQAELYRTLGLIHTEGLFYLQAELYFSKAIDLENYESHFDLAVLMKKLFKINDAEEEIKSYLSHFPGNQEAETMLKEIQELPFYGNPEEKISVAMIVKNEEAMLADCIESFREAVDEIVIVDTGSTDRTVEIAKEYNVKLYHHEWKDDFSEARNFSISKTTGEWVMIVDADERLEREDIQFVRAIKWQKEYNVLCFGVYSTLPGQLGNSNFGKHYSPRIFRKSPDIYYYGIVHNILNIPDKTGMTAIRLYHLGYDLDQGKMEKKFDRSIKLLLKQVEESPDDPFILMNTAQMYLSRNYMEEAEEYATRCVEAVKDGKKDQEHLLLMGLYQSSLIKLALKEYEKSEELVMRALSLKDDYIDPMLTLGWGYYYTKQYDKALDILARFLEARERNIAKEDFNLLILSKLGSDYEANYLIGEIHRERGDYDRADECYGKSLESNPHYWNVFNSRGKIYLEQGKYSEAADAFENAVKYGYMNLEKYGMTGASSEEYQSAVTNYKTAVEKDVTAQQKKPKVSDALSKIDALLSDDED